MSKQQLIEAIRQRNRTAQAEFLIGFSQEVLENYLRRLTQVAGCRGPKSVWVRDADAPAAVNGQCRA